MQAGHQQNREPGTGGFYVDNASFRDWLNGTTPYVWLNGDVGCGKTVLCSSFIEKLQTNNPHELDFHECTLAYFYFTWNDTKAHDFGTFLRSILAQLAQDERFIDHLENLFQESKKRVLNRGDMLNVLLTCIESIQPADLSYSGLTDPYSIGLSRSLIQRPVFLIFDALDEVPYGPQRDEILSFLSRLAECDAKSVRMLVTSRKDPDIRARLLPKSEWKSEEIDPYWVNVDVRRFVDGQISRHWNLKMQTQKVKSLISDGIVERANGM